MNVKKTIFVVGGIGIILILLAIRFGWFDPLKKQKNVPVKEIAPAAVEKSPKKVIKQRSTPQAKARALPAVKKKVPGVPPVTPAVKAEKKELLGAGDPFVYSAAGSGDYTPLSGNKNVGIITVKGIIHIEGEYPKAILHLQESNRIHYVSKDSVVRVSSKNKSGTSPAEAYIVVKDIRNDEVELIQLERPDKVIIIR